MDDLSIPNGARSLRQSPRSVRQYAATLRKKGIFTIPQEIRDEVNLHEGDNMIVTVQDGSIILTPAAPLIPRDQAWFWTPQWQMKETEADADLTTGNTEVFLTDKDFLDSFDKETGDR